MNSSYSIGNLFENAGKKKIFGFLFAGVIIVILLAVLLMMVSGGVPNNEDEQGNNDDETTEDEVPVNTEYSAEHEYTLSEFLPRAYYEVLDDGTGVDMKYDIVENSAIPKGIVVTLGGCDEEKNRLSANEYLGTLPIEPGEYEITYIVKGCESKY